MHVKCEYLSCISKRTTLFQVPSSQMAQYDIFSICKTDILLLCKFVPFAFSLFCFRYIITMVLKKKFGIFPEVLQLSPHAFRTTEWIKRRIMWLAFVCMSTEYILSCTCFYRVPMCPPSVCLSRIFSRSSFCSVGCLFVFLIKPNLIRTLQIEKMRELLFVTIFDDC